jgi:hypothetical protein
MQFLFQKLNPEKMILQIQIVMSVVTQKLRLLPYCHLQNVTQVYLSLFMASVHAGFETGCQVN